MAVKLGQISNSNLLPLANWTAGSGGVTGFAANETTATENQRLNGTGPYGATVLVWECRPSGDGNADGGWNSSYYSYDRTKLYRQCVWVRRTSSTSGGTFYFGLQTNGTGSVIPIYSGGTQTNPYWDYRGTSFFNQNQWYLAVGHLYPAGTSRSIANPNSGLYTSKSGKNSPLQGNIPYDGISPNDATTIMNRTYLYYCADSTTRLQFYAPRIDLVDGTEPSIEQLLDADYASSSSYPQGIQFSDTTWQTTMNPGTVATPGVGGLIGIFPYTIPGSFTWTVPTGCTKAFVKVVGGGGGGAGYCESGGAGGYSETYVDLTGVTSVAITVGTGGTGVSYYNTATNGGSSSFGAYASATGGYGANQNASHTGGQGGVGSSGYINLNGGSGLGHTNSAGTYPGGVPGASYWGGGGNVNRGNNVKLYNGAPGAGGPGGLTDGAGLYGEQGEFGAVVIYAYR